MKGRSSERPFLCLHVLDLSVFSVLVLIPLFGLIEGYDQGF